ncbi:MAG: hypothetical protein ACOY3K_06340 [Candidatus Omnitrophota bacterium]
MMKPSQCPFCGRVVDREMLAAGVCSECGAELEENETEERERGDLLEEDDEDGKSRREDEEDL